MFGIDESPDAASILRNVHQSLWHSLMHLGTWRCHRGPDSEAAPCRDDSDPRSAFLHSFPYAPGLQGCGLGPGLLFWDCREKGECVREGEACQMSTRVRSGLPCPPGYSEVRRGAERFCVRKVCPTGKWACGSR